MRFSNFMNYFITITTFMGGRYINSMSFTYSSYYSSKRMPRVSLPVCLKNLLTYEVLTTQTTEDDLRLHFKGLYKIFENTNKKYKTRISDIFGEFLDLNPYSGKDWKKGPPKRYFNEAFAWFGTNDDEMEEYSKYSQLLRDLKLIKKVFEWTEIDDMIYEMDQFQAFISSSQDDLLKLEHGRFTMAKLSFELENAEWIKEQDLIKNHKQNHPSGYTLFHDSEEGKQIDLSCVHCKKEFEREKEQIESHRLNQHLSHPSKEDVINYIESGIDLDYLVESCKFCADQINILRSTVKKIVKDQQSYHCDECNFKTKDEVLFDNHYDGQFHIKAVKRNEFYCKDCDTQCQSKQKYQEHLESTKHNKNKPTEFRCEKCNYTTKFKHHYEQHCNTKKHKETVE